LLNGTAIKKIARTQRISKNTIKRYRSLVNEILETQPEIKENIDAVIDQFKLLRSQQRFSENYGWLETNDNLVELHCIVSETAGIRFQGKLFITDSLY